MMFLCLLAFIAMLVIGVPIAFSIIGVSFLSAGMIPALPYQTIVMRMQSGLNSFVLLAVPLYILCATIMDSGQISMMMIEWCTAILGNVRGGLAHANVLVSMIFAGVSGSATADTAGIGKILIPSMIGKGYDKGTSVGVTSASSTIGVIIPPSIPMIVYGGLTNASVARMFIAGLIPGIMVGGGQMAVIALNSKRKNMPKEERRPAGEVAKLTLRCLPALITPVIIMGGIIFGWYTPTEAAAFATLYALFISLFVYKTIKLKDLGRIFADTLKLSCLSLFALSAASALGEVLSYLQIHAHVAQFFLTYVHSRAVFLALIIVFFLFIGTFMDNIPAMILFIPILIPIATSFGISMELLGMITVITLAIGQVTPPYGMCLLIAGSIADLPVGDSFKAVLPYISVLLVVVILICIFPGIIEFLPNLAGV